MSRLLALLSAVLVSICVAVNESPVSKVISLLEDLKKEVEQDGEKEAKAYADYACFCKDTTKEKSDSIEKGKDSIDSLSADIAKNTAEKEGKIAEVKERKEKHKELGESLTGEVTKCSKAQADYEYKKADMEKAIASLEKAIKAMNGKKSKAGGASLMALPEDVAQNLALADAMNLVEDKQRPMIGAFLQGAAKVDPKDPAYKYHSKAINELLAKMEKTFNDNKKDNQDKWDKIEDSCNTNKKDTAKTMKENLDTIAKLEEDIKDLEKTIAKDREDLVEAQDQMKEDELYLKDLTKQCETRARDYDQRSQMRADEITALSKATSILKDSAKENYAGSVDKEDLLQTSAFLQAVKSVEQADAKILHTVRALSFVQWGASESPANGAFLSAGSVVQAATQQKVLDLLRVEGDRLSSPVLSSMAMQVARQRYPGSSGDPFKAVKKLIQGLIERLLEEANAEASKEGFCQEELAKAQKDRDFAMAKSKKISADLAVYEAHKEELEEEIKELKKDIEDLEKELKKAKKLRDEDHDTNMETLKKANEGLKAVEEAILVLKTFYKSAANKAANYEFLQASPVDADTSGPGFSGAYGANHGKYTGPTFAIFELLDTIVGNFKANIKEVEKDEADAAAEFVDFDRTSKSDIKSKETKQELDEQDLKTTNKNIDTGLNDLDTQMGLVGDAVKMLDELKPACLDTGMGYKERVEKREEEIAALKKALCIIDPKGEDCGK